MIHTPNNRRKSDWMENAFLWFIIVLLTSATFFPLGLMIYGFVKLVN